MRRLCVGSPVKVSVLGGFLALAVIPAGGDPWRAPAGASAQQRVDMKNPFEGDPEAVAYGAERFSERCTFCHGTRGKGAKGPCLVCGHFKHGGSNADLFATISAGRSGTQMGAFASSLSGDEIWKIILFLREEQRKREAGAEATPKVEIGATQ